MEKEQPRPPPEPAPDVRDDPRVVAHRCPFCHEPVRPDDEAWVACARCLGRQHAACWDEGGRCAACRHDRSLAPTGRRSARPPRSAAPLRLLVAVFATLLVVGWLVGLLLLAPAPPAVNAPPLEFSPPPPLPSPPVVALELTPPSPAPSPPAPGLWSSSADRLRALRDAELERADAAERARLLGADGAAEPGGERSSTRQEPFTWLPDGAADVDVARRLVREQRERALEREGDVNSLVLLAHVNVYTGNPAQAVVDCERALDQDPRHGPAWTVRGWARLALDDRDGAELDLLRGQRLSDDPTWAEIGLGRLTELRGRLPAALLHYEAGLQLGRERLERPVDHVSDLRRRIERLERLVEGR